MARRTATIVIPAQLDRHPVIMKLARLLKLDVDCVIGKVVKIIDWCAQNSTDGIVEGAQLEDFEAVARHELGNAFGTLLERISVPGRGTSGTREQVQLCAFLECFGKAAKNKALSARRKARHADCIACARTHARQPAGSKTKSRKPAGADKPKEIQVQKGQQPAVEPAPEMTVELEDAPPGVPQERIGYWIDYFARTLQMPRPVAEELLAMEQVTEDRIRWAMERTRKRLEDAKRGIRDKLNHPWRFFDKLLREGPGQRGTFGSTSKPAASFESRKNSMLEQARTLAHSKAVAAAGGVG